MKVMSFGCRKLLETKNFWNFSGQFSPYNIFQGDFFFIQFPIQNFSLQLSRYHIFHSFSILKNCFYTNFPATIFSPDAHFFTHFPTQNFLPQNFDYNFSIFSLLYNLFFTYFSNKIFHQGWCEVVRGARRSPQPPPSILGPLYSSKKIIRGEPFYRQLAITFLRLLMFYVLYGVTWVFRAQL